MTDKTELEVTQRAREAAAELLAGMNEGISEGLRDSLSVVQAFARFERDILATRAPDPTPIAWMYQCGRSRIVKENDDLGLSGYTKTPLYAAPPTVHADGLVEALCHIKDETQRRQLPLTSLINDIATQALAAHRGEA